MDAIYRLKDQPTPEAFFAALVVESTTSQRETGEPDPMVPVFLEILKHKRYLPIVAGEKKFSDVRANSENGKFQRRRGDGLDIIELIINQLKYEEDSAEYAAYSLLIDLGTSAGHNAEKSALNLLRMLDACRGRTSVAKFRKDSLPFLKLAIAYAPNYQYER